MESEPVAKRPRISDDTVEEDSGLSLEEKIKVIQHQLLLIFHAHRCLRRKESKPEDSCAPDQPPCIVPHCKTMGCMLVHMRTCARGIDCPVSLCVSSRSLIAHYKSCRRKDCSVCIPVRLRRDCWPDLEPKTSMKTLPCIHTRRFFSAIEKEVQCSVCLEQLIEPVSLTKCCHTICRRCLLQLINGDEIPCPLCRKVTNKKDFVCNYPMKHLVSVFEQFDLDSRMLIWCNEINDTCDMCTPLKAIKDHIHPVFHCRLCSNIFTEPKFLTKCGHSFCGSCITVVSGATADDPAYVLCPTCGQTTEESSIPDAFQTKTLVEIYKRYFQDEPKAAAASTAEGSAEPTNKQAVLKNSEKPQTSEECSAPTD